MRCTIVTSFRAACWCAEVLWRTSSSISLVVRWWRAEVMATLPTPLPVFEHCLVLYRRTWRGSLFSTFLLPLLFLFGMGVSLGSYVDLEGKLGAPYLDYIAPGLLASTALQVAIAESTWPILGGFEWRRTFFGMQASPLRPQDIVGGESLFVLMRAGTCAVGYLLAMALFGTLHTLWSLA